MLSSISGDKEKCVQKQVLLERILSRKVNEDLGDLEDDNVNDDNVEESERKRKSSKKGIAII